jgi:hypothetical protein
MEGSIKEQWCFLNKENKCALKKWKEVPRNIGISLRKTNVLQSIEGILGQQQHLFNGENVCFKEWMVLLKGGDGNMFHNLDVFF